MENTLPAERAYHSHSYEGRLLHLYTRVGRNYYALNETFVCLAGVEVKAEYRGKGLFSSLLQHIEKHEDQLRATYLAVESVANPRFASKLDALGFSRFELVHPDSSPTFYRRLGASSPKTQ